MITHVQYFLLHLGHVIHFHNNEKILFKIGKHVFILFHNLNKRTDCHLLDGSEVCWIWMQTSGSLPKTESSTQDHALRYTHETWKRQTRNQMGTMYKAYINRHLKWSGATSNQNFVNCTVWLHKYPVMSKMYLTDLVSLKSRGKILKATNFRLKCVY